MEEKIAIVIPAYKCRFLRQTLDSIVVQTCRSFTVYIGDDASPQNLKEIVSDYADKMNIVYRRFDTNLGLCHITDGKLTGVTETHNIFKTADGAESREDGQPAEKLDLNELVSMNMWGLTPAFMDTLYDGFVEFLQNVKAGDIKAEYLLPVMIDALIQKGTAQVDVLETKDTWFGVTYQEDKEVVIKAFKELTEAGVYPNGLYK